MTSKQSMSEEVPPDLLVDLQKALADIDSKETALAALNFIQEALSNFSNQVLSLISFNHIKTIVSFILDSQLAEESFYTLSFIQLYSSEFTDYFISDEFIDLLMSAFSHFDSLIFHAFCSFAANVAYDTEKFIDSLNAHGFFATMFSKKDIKQTSETRKFLSYVICHPHIKGELFKEILDSQVVFLKSFLNKEDFENNFDKAMKVNNKKDVILCSILNTLREVKEKKQPEKKEDQIIAFLISKQMYQTLIQIADLQLEPVSVTSLEIIENTLKFGSDASSVIDSLLLFDHLKTLLSSESQEIISETMRCMTAFICCFPEFAQEGVNCFVNFNFLHFFFEGNYYQKQCVIAFLSQIMDEIPDDLKQEIFTLETMTEFISFSEIPEEKIHVYRMIGRLLNSVQSEPEWILEILEGINFWDTVDEEQYSNDNDEHVFWIEQLLSLYHQLRGDE